MTTPHGAVVTLDAMRYGTLTHWLTAVLCGVWFVGFGWSEPHTALLATPLVIAGAALLPVSARGGAALVVLAQIVTLIAGAGWGNVELVLMMAFALFTLGRTDSQWWPGVAAVLVGAGASAARDGITVGKFAIVGVLYAMLWLFGVVVRHRAIGAYRAVAQATELARQDPEVVSARLAVAERAQLADKAIFAIRAAILRMQDAARDALNGLDAESVRAVHSRGVTAVAELGELLGLLREPPPADDPPRPSLATPATKNRDLYPALGITVVLGVVWFAAPGLELGVGVLVLYVGTIAAVALRRVAPVTACLVAAVASVVAAIDPPAVPEQLLPAAAGYALIAWTVASHTIYRVWTAWALLIAAAVSVAVSYGLRGIAFILLIFAASTWAGYAWHERDRILRAAELRSKSLQAQIKDATLTATRAERLGLARELHDVTSHSVGAMLMQAGAARALRDSAPAEARAALTTVIDTADAALQGIDVLVAALDGGDYGPMWYSYADTCDLREALDRLIQDMSVIGMDITTELHELPQSPALTAATFRVVQEGLANAARHAPGAKVRVSVARNAHTYIVRISDDGADTSVMSGFGFGLAGLRERVQSCAGEFSAGREGDRGFTIEARLPLDGGRALE
ncbi:Signal transduction histidine kinase [Micrococcales bacterium KH10]|nr:Signal transduction histidine kinase [Micrococcales bacterium KH10]